MKRKMFIDQMNDTERKISSVFYNMNRKTINFWFMGNQIKNNATQDKFGEQTKMQYLVCKKF